VVLFTQRYAQPPEPLAILARKLAQHCLKHRRDFDLASAAEALEFSGATRHHLPEVAELLRTAAAFALKHIDEFSSPLLMRLASAIEGWDSEGQTALAMAVARRSSKLDLRLPSTRGCPHEQNLQSEHKYFPQPQSGLYPLSPNNTAPSRCYADAGELAAVGSVLSDGADTFSDASVDEFQASSAIRDKASFAMDQSFHTANVHPCTERQQSGYIPAGQYQLADIPDLVENALTPKMNAFAKEFVPSEVPSPTSSEPVDSLEEDAGSKIPEYVVRNTFIDVLETDKEVVTRRLSANTFRSQPRWMNAAPAV
jgi:hypothetical protein